ncbi:hypothetical protein Bca4012_021556 [Brassica carinata]
MMVKKKKKQSRSESSTEKTPKKTLDSKLANGKDSKHMIRGMSSKPTQGLSSQSRVVRCPKCHKFLQEPADVTIYKCSGCNSILQAKHWDNDKDLLSPQNRSLSTEVESAEDSGSKTPVRSSYRKYSSRASPCFETAYRRHETSYIRREWMTRSDVSDAFASARSCSGVVTKKEDTTTLLDLLRSSDYGTSFAEETLDIHHQYSASDSHLSSSDKGSGDGICISNDDVILKRNLETFEDKGIKEDIRSKFYDLKLESFQLSLREQQPASSENTGETSRIHLEQSEEESAEGGGSKTPVRSSYRKYSSRASPLFETAYRRRHETTTHIRREWMRSASPSPSSYGYTSSPFHGSQVSASEQSYHRREGWFQEFSSAAASPIRSQGETSDQKCYNWSSQQSQMLHDSQYHNLHESSSWSGVLKLSSVTKKEEGDVIRRSVSSEFYDLKPEDFQPRWSHKSSEATGETSRIHLEQAHSVETNLLSEKYTRDMQEFDLGELKWEDITGDKGDSICDSSSSNGEMYEEDTVVDTKHISNQSFIGNPEQSGEEATVTTYMIHEKQSKHDEYENISERQELDKCIGDRVRYELEDARLETVYAGERRWEETMEDRAGLHLEEYENYSNPFEWTSVEAQGRSESSSRGSLSDHESSEDIAVIQESRDAKPDQSRYEIASERQELSNTVLGIVRTDIIGDGSELRLEEHQNNSHEWTSKRASTFPLHEHELGTISVSERSISSSKNVFDDHESSKESALAHEEENKIEELKVGVVVEDGPSLHFDKWETFGLTEESTQVFCLHEPELGTLLEPDNEEADDGSSESSSMGSFNSHESSKLRAVFHQEEPQVVMSDSRTEMISVKLEDIFEWTSERAPTFHLYEPELGALLEDAYGRSESSSRGSFNDHVIPKEREMMIHGEDEPWLVDAYETKALKVVEDGASLDLEKFENEKLLLDQSREDHIFRLSLDDTIEQERMTFQLKISQDKEVNLRQTFKQGDTEENILASGSVLSSQGHEPRSITAEAESEAEKEILRDHFKHLQKETIVGLRHALYQTQTSPPLSSPIHTPIGSSPLHIRMRSSMNSHIVSLLRSPTNSSGSLSDVLFLAKKT